MAVTTEATITVAIAEFHAAVRAVLPHADKPRLGDPDLALARVRLIAAKDELLLVATNARTSAMAAIEISEDSRRERFAVDDGEFTVDVHPKILRDLQAGVTAQKDEGELVGDCEITVRVGGGPGGVDPGTIAVRDVGGLWVGAETTRPLLPFASSFPDVRSALARAMGECAGTFKALVADGGDLAAFRSAAAAYGQPLQAEPVGEAQQRGWLVWCGPDFIGSLMGEHAEDSMARREANRRAHLARLGLVSSVPELVGF